MQNKRGQLTIIIIIAIAIIVLALLIYFFWPQISSLFMNEEQAQRFLASQAEPLREAISRCIEEISLKGFEKIGLQAGYYDNSDLPKLEYAETTFTVVMYKDSLKNRINKLPSLTQIESQYNYFLEKEGNEKIDSCLKNLSSFKRVMNIEARERKINAFIHNDVIMIYVDWPMRISKSTLKNKVAQEINQKPIMLLIPFGYLWQNANAVVDCETQINCKYEGFNWDKDVWNNPSRIQYIRREARTIEKNKIAFYLESIPYRLNEKPFKFNFAIDRT